MDTEIGSFLLLMAGLAAGWLSTSPAGAGASGRASGLAAEIGAGVADTNGAVMGVVVRAPDGRLVFQPARERQVPVATGFSGRIR